MRSFIELELPVETKKYVRQRQDAIRGALSEQGLATCFRWTKISGIHLTLRFLGETSTAQRQVLADGLDSVAQEWPPLSLGADIFGAFPSTFRPRVLWLGLRGDLDGLRKLQGQVELIVQDCGFEAESRPYAPHLTIARTKRDCPKDDVKQAGALLAQMEKDQPHKTKTGRFTATTLIHMRSDLQPSGPVYTPLSTFYLAG